MPMSEPVDESKPRRIPDDIASKLKAWRFLWNGSSRMHYVCGGLSVLASAIAATGGDYAKYFSVAAACLTALIGFVRPQHAYFKFVRAWRVLDIAALRYKHSLIEIDDLISAVERGEKLISEFEDKEDAASASEARKAREAAEAKVGAKNNGADPSDKAGLEEQH
jgi:hypothetical protein